MQGRLVLVGDERQLPPTVRSRHAGPRLAISLFERLLRHALLRRQTIMYVSLQTLLCRRDDIRPVKTAGLPLPEPALTRAGNTCRLREQYRMHPAVSAFPREYFYEGHLGDGVGEEARQASHHSQVRACDSHPSSGSCLPPIASGAVRARPHMPTPISERFLMQVGMGPFEVYNVVGGRQDAGPGTGHSRTTPRGGSPSASWIN